MANVATLEEVERHWDLMDVFSANLILDERDRSQEEAEENQRRRLEASKQTKRGRR